MRVRISIYTVPELDVFRTLCNFTDDEAAVFELLARDWDLAGVKQQMRERGRSWSESKIANLSSGIKCKLRRIMKEFPDKFVRES